MAKFELPIHDLKTGEVAKTYQRGFMPVDLYVRFQKLAEKMIEEKYKSDEEMFNDFEDLFVELFPDLTREEYKKCTDVAEVLQVWDAAINKSTQIESGNSSKNG